MMLILMSTKNTINSKTLDLQTKLPNSILVNDSLPINKDKKVLPQVAVTQKIKKPTIPTFKQNVYNLRPRLAKKTIAFLDLFSNSFNYLN